MTNYYVLCNRDTQDNRLVYYTGSTEAHGDSYYGDVLEAKRFESLGAVAECIAKSGSEFYLGVNIINIPDVTFDKLLESKNGDRELYAKYHDPNYAIR